MKILSYTVLCLIGIILLTAILVNIPIVQNWLVKQVTTRLSKDLNTTVKVKHIDFNLALFNKMSLEGTLVNDRRKDTLLYAGKVNIRLTDWFFLQNKIVLKYIGLEDAFFHLHRRDSVWNYQFIIDYFSAPPSAKKKKGIDLDLKIVELANVRFLQKDEWRGEDMFFYMRSMDVDARQINLTEKTIDINDIALEDPLFSISHYPGRRPQRILVKNEEVPIVNDTTLKWNPDAWNLAVSKFTIQNGIFKTFKQSDRKINYYFDGQNIVFSKINSTFKNIKLIKDTVTANVSLSTRERSGFQVKSFTANFKMQPQGMRFADLDIKTNKSHLGNLFALSYNEFDDMSEFMEKVRIEGVFRNSELSSDDIAYFAPDVANWKKRIYVTGTVKGTISNLSTKNITIRAGNNTILKGDLKMVGLPEIDKTFIDFKANDFRTTYNDAIAFIPQLKKLMNHVWIACNTYTLRDISPVL